MIAGASHLSKREIEGRVEPQAARVIGALLAFVGIGVGLAVGAGAWASYALESDGALLLVGIVLVLVDLFVIWAFRAARQEAEYNALVEERERSSCE